MTPDQLPLSLRHRMKLKLRETARRMGISHTYLRDMERGDRPVSNEMLAKYREATKKPSARVAA